MLTARGWDVHVATRFHDAAEPVKRHEADWAASRDAGLTLIDASGPETPPGAAIITAPPLLLDGKYWPQNRRVVDIR